MSHEGKILRGKKWYAYRDIDGNLPEDILKDKNKMKDVNYYLESLKVVKENKSKEKK